MPKFRTPGGSLESRLRQSVREQASHTSENQLQSLLPHQTHEMLRSCISQSQTVTCYLFVSSNHWSEDRGWTIIFRRAAWNAIVDKLRESCLSVRPSVRLAVCETRGL